MSPKEDSFDYQVLNLTNKFYADYPNPPYKEIVRKNSRPYNCLLVQSHYGYFICSVGNVSEKQLRKYIEN